MLSENAFLPPCLQARTRRCTHKWTFVTESSETEIHSSCRGTLASWGSGVAQCGEGSRYFCMLRVWYCNDNPSKKKNSEEGFKKQTQQDGNARLRLVAEKTDHLPFIMMTLMRWSREVCTLSYVMASRQVIPPKNPPWIQLPS